MDEIFVDRVQELKELLGFIHNAGHVSAPYIGIKVVVGLPGYGKTTLLKTLYNKIKNSPNVLTAFVDSYSPKLLEELYEHIISKGKISYKLKRFVHSIVVSRYMLSMLLDALGEFIQPIPMKPFEILIENIIKSSELIKELRERYSLALRIIKSLNPQTILVIIVDDFSSIHLVNFIEIFLLLPLAAIEKQRKICIITAIRSSQIDEFMQFKRNYYSKLLTISRILKLSPPIIHAIDFDDPLFLRELPMDDCIVFVQKAAESEGMRLNNNEAREICKYARGHPLIALLSIRRHKSIKLKIEETYMRMALEYITDKDVLKLVSSDVYEILSELSKEGKRDELLLLYIVATSGGGIDTMTIHKLLRFLSPNASPALLLDERVRQLITVRRDVIQFTHPIIHSATLMYFFKYERPLISRNALIQVLDNLKQHYKEHAIVFALLHKDSLDSRWFNELMNVVSRSNSLLDVLSIFENIYFIYENLINARILGLGPDYCYLIYEYSKHKLTHGMYFELLNILSSSIEKCQIFPELYTLLYSCYAYATALYGDFEKSIDYSNMVIERIENINIKELSKDLIIAYARACFSKALSLHALGKYRDAAEWYRRTAEVLMYRGIPMNNIHSPQLGITLLVPHTNIYTEIIDDKDLLWLCARMHLQVAHLLSIFDREKSLKMEKKLYTILNELSQQYSDNIILQELLLSTMHRLAWSLKSIGLREEALILEDKVMELSLRQGMLSLYGLAALGKANMLIEKNNYDEALSLLETACTTLKSVEYFGEYAKCILNKARLLYLLGRYKESCDILADQELHHLLSMTKYISVRNMYHKLKAEIFDRICRDLTT